MTRRMEMVQFQTLMHVPSETKEQPAQFQQHRVKPAVLEITLYTLRSRGVLVIKLTDELRELVSDERDAIQNHQLPVQSLTALIQQAKAQSVTAVSRQNSLIEVRQVFCVGRVAPQGEALLCGGEEYSRHANG